MQPVQRVISIAGLDPSGGAGVFADIKTFEQIAVHGCGVATCITYQNDIKFGGVHWLDFDEILSQFMSLAERWEFGYAKIGFIESAEMLNIIVTMLKNHNTDIKIIWDPIMETSSGALIHESNFGEEVSQSIKNLYLITPNREEAKILGLDNLVSKANVLVTGEIDESRSLDVLYTEGEMYRFDTKRLENADKHGSGCVLSAAITSYLSLGNSLVDSCRKAKEYTHQFLQSAPGLLGFHHSIAINESYVS